MASERQFCLLINSSSVNSKNQTHMKYLIFFFLSLCHLSGFSQVIDDQFQDSTFSRSLWEGDWDKFAFDGGLRSNSITFNDTFGLFTSIHYDTNKVLQWEISLDVNLETSSLNYVDINLLADTLSKHKRNTYIRIGGSKDEVGVYQKVEGNEATLLAQGPDKFTSKTRIDIRATISNHRLLIEYANDFSYRYDSLEIVDINWESSIAQTGFIIRQSTSSFFGKHKILSFFCGQPKQLMKPKISLHEMISENELFLTFNQDVAAYSKYMNAFISNGSQTIGIEWMNSRQLKIQFDKNVSKEVFVVNVDSFCNHQRNCQDDTVLRVVNFKRPNLELDDVIITEFLSDPHPQVSLPEGEFVEILNRTDSIIRLRNWILSDGKDENVLPDSSIGPGEYIVICDRDFAASFAQFGRIIAVEGLITLNNSGDTLSLRSSNDQVINQVVYAEDWFVDSWKSDGGWSFEIKDVSHPCASNNWAFSTSTSGGSPSAINSQNQLLNDVQPPCVISSFPQNSRSLKLAFDSPIFIRDPQDIQLYSEQIVIKGFSLEMPMTVFVLFENELTPAHHYTLNISGFTDCFGNQMSDTAISFGLPVPVEPADVIINEILFNPSSDGVDFVEIMNQNKQFYDLFDLMLSRKNDDGEWEKLVPIVAESTLISPGELIGITTNLEALKRAHLHPQKMNLVEVGTLPSMPDKSGNLGIALRTGQTIDWLEYSSDMHFPLLSIEEGVSLERISPFKSTNDVNNWTSGSFSTGYATPGYVNSAEIEVSQFRGKIEATPDPFSPNGDGYNDVLNIQFKLPFTEGVFHLRIFDLSGNLVAFPINTEHAGGTDNFTWNGTTTSGGSLKTGMYVIHLEALSIDGRNYQLKAPVTLVLD